MTQEQHFDVAAYALGVLDNHDAARFEDHLLTCATCAIELESMLPVVDLLADIDADSIVATEQSRHDGVVLHKMIGAVSKERRREKSRRLYSLAAAVVVFAMLSIGALFVGGEYFGTPPRNTPEAIKTLPPLPGPAGQGGPDLSEVRVQGTDPRTNVNLDMGVEEKEFGTVLKFKVSNLDGPKICRLVAVRSDGKTEPLTTWRIGEGKKWTAENAPALEATTALPTNQIAAFQVEEVTASGTQTLLTVSG